MIKETLDLIKGNQMLSAGVGVYSAGVATFMLRNVPLKIYSFLKRHLTTSITITSYHSVFHDTMKWFEEEFKGKNFRTIKLSNGRWGDDESIKSIGYGKHFFFYKKTPMLIELIKDEGNDTSADKDIITITRLGRSHDIFNDIISEFKNVEEDDAKVKLYSLAEHGWEYSRSQFKRNMDSIFIDTEKKNNIKNRLNKFINNEDWYIENGIPYQMGILLHGAPGTGKTSLIKGIASYLEYPIYYIESSKLSKIEDAISRLPSKCLLIIEDIDSNSATHGRDNNIENKSKDKDNKISKMFNLASLSSILNSIDGMFSPHGRILIATTNHIDKLDPALIRPGRIDLKVEVGYVNIEILKQFMSNYFDMKDIDFKDINIEDKLTVAKLQNYILEGRNKYEILDLVNKT